MQVQMARSEIRISVIHFGLLQLHKSTLSVSVCGLCVFVCLRGVTVLKALGVATLRFVKVTRIH